MPPVITSLNPSSGPAAGGTAVTISGSGFLGVTSVKFGTASAGYIVISSSTINATSPAGSGQVAVTVTASTGTSNGVTYTYLPVPVITSLTPNQGPTSGGNNVIINGSGFTDATSVKFGSSSAGFTTVSDTQITATAPTGSGSVTVTVTAPAGTSNGVTYTYLPAPVITSLIPSQGPTSGGNNVTINGSGFTGATSVKFGAHSATITLNSGTQMTVIPPASPAGSVSVSVTTPGGTSTPVAYFAIAPPVITGLDPTMGPALGGNTVSIFGSNLTLTGAVTFGTGHAASNLSVVSDNQVTVTAPSSTGTVTVALTTPGGTTLSGLGNAYYTYLPAPVIDSVSPTVGSTFGGNGVTITGHNLTYTDEVRFDSAPASFYAISDTKVVAVAPGGAPGNVTVTVHTPAGTSNSATYEYV